MKKTTGLLLLFAALLTAAWLSFQERPAGDLGGTNAAVPACTETEMNAVLAFVERGDNIAEYLSEMEELPECAFAVRLQGVVYRMVLSLGDTKELDEFSARFRGK